MPLLGTFGSNSAKSLTPIAGGGTLSLYDFTTHTFTNAGQTGAYGPSLNTIRSSYNVPWGNDYLGMTVTGIQRWTVPATASYTIDVRGASGDAYSSRNRRGYGYRLSGNFALESGQIVQIAVGQGGWNGGGSGGGSFVVLDDNGTHVPLIIAGGGGAQDGRYSHSNGDAWENENGRSSSDGYSGGSGGNGGSGPGSNGTPGAGYRTDNQADGRGPFGFLRGGSAPTSNSLVGDASYGGGFGGGGGSSDDQGSGGGGYSGGAGTSEDSTGGGGGSYFNTSYGSGRINSGNTSDTHGRVVITKIL